MKRKPEPTERDLEVLDDLRAACENYRRIDAGEWVRPLDCGGTNGSDHSYRLNRLAELGLAEAAKRGGWTRGSKKYRITQAGIDRLKQASGGER